MGFAAIYNIKLFLRKEEETSHEEYVMTKWDALKATVCSSVTNPLLGLQVAKVGMPYLGSSSE